jgi:hypothetical protein
MYQKRYELESEVLVYQGTAAWRFLALPQPVAEEIRETYGKGARAWGSLPVRVQIGSTQWKTSIFPDKKRGTYLLPLKAAVRKAEAIIDADTVSYALSI